MIPLAAVVPETTFSPPPTDRIAAVYRKLDLRVSDDPLVTVTAVGGNKRPGLGGQPAGIEFLWRVTESPDGTATVTIHKRTGKWEIASALFEAVD